MERTMCPQDGIVHTPVSLEKPVGLYKLGSSGE